MENIIEEMRQHQINLLKNNEYVTQKDINILNKSFNKKKPSNNISSNKSKKLNFYSNHSIKYKPFYIKEREKKSNLKPKKEYETHIVSNTKNNQNINNPALINIINETQFKKSKEKNNLNEFVFNDNKTLLWYEILSSYDSYNKETEKKTSTKEKNKKINKFNKDEEILEELNRMHESIIKKREEMENSNKKIEINNYQDVLNILMKDIEMIRKERKLENDIFKKRIEFLEDNIFPNKLLKYKTPKKEIDKLGRIYLSKKYKSNKFKRSNKLNTTKGEIKNKGRFSSYNKKEKNYLYNNIHRDVNYTMYKYNNSFNNINKNLPKYLRKKLKEEKKEEITMKKKHNFQFYKKIMNEIKKLNEENILILKKYKNISISEEELNEIILRKVSKTGINKEINYKRNRFFIKNKINQISRKLIDDLLYECIYDLMIIENKKSNNINKIKLISGFNNILENLDKLTEKEKKLISKYNNIIEKNESRSFKMNYNIIPIKSKIKNVKISDDFVNKIEEDRLKIGENMLLHGCFYSDFDIFEIYDEYVDEQTKIILDEEINYIINKYELFVDKLCNEEYLKAEDEFNGL